MSNTIADVYAYDITAVLQQIDWSLSDQTQLGTKDLRTFMNPLETFFRYIIDTFEFGCVVNLDTTALTQPLVSMFNAQTNAMSVLWGLLNRPHQWAGKTLYVFLIQNKLYVYVQR